MATDPAPVLTLYSRNYCHLCDEMIAALLDLQASAAFTLEIVDVDADPDLDQRLGERVPVLMASARELCTHRLDREGLLAFLGLAGK